MRKESNKGDSEEEENEAMEQRRKDIELSIRKKFHKQLFSRFARGINDYELVKPGDKIAVCISGGKDSMLMAKLFQELKRHNKFPFELVFLVMDPGYNEANRAVIEHNAKLLGIPITVFETEILMQFTMWKNLRVISAPVCGEDIFTARQKNLDATRSPLDITMMM